MDARDAEMEGPEGVTPWKDPTWRMRAEAWIEHEMHKRGARLTGHVEQPHIRPWSTVLRAPTTMGIVFLKAPFRPQRQEIALTADLYGRYPDRIIEVLSADEDRGWLLLADGGTRLRDAIRPMQDISPWFEVLPRYAELQIDQMNRVDELLAMGVPDRRPRELAAQLEGVLADTTYLRIDRDDGLTRPQYMRVLELLPTICAACEQLERAGIPATLHHGDLHDGNVFASDRGYRFFDWSDSSISHPYFSLRTVAVSVETSLNLDEGTAPVETLRDAYLQPWLSTLSRANAIEAFDLAQRLWSLPSLFVWLGIFRTVDGSDTAPYAYAIPSLLVELLNAFDR